MDSKLSPDELTLGRIFNNLSLLTFSILFLISSILLLEPNKSLSDFLVSDYLGAGLLFLSFIFFVELVVDVSMFYLTKSWKSLKTNFRKYTWYYSLGVLGGLLLFIFCVAYVKLTRENFWMVATGISVPSIFALIKFAWKKSQDTRKVQE